MMGTWSFIPPKKMWATDNLTPKDWTLFSGIEKHSHWHGKFPMILQPGFHTRLGSWQANFFGAHRKTPTEKKGSQVISGYEFTPEINVSTVIHPKKHVHGFPFLQQGNDCRWISSSIFSLNFQEICPAKSMIIGDSHRPVSEIRRGFSTKRYDP